MQPGEGSPSRTYHTWMAIFQAVSLGALPRGGGGRAGWDLVSKLCFNHKKNYFIWFLYFIWFGEGVYKI